MEKPKRTFWPTQYISNDIKCKMFQLKDKDFQTGGKKSNYILFIRDMSKT